jgi:hypothetical protein
MLATRHAGIGRQRQLTDAETTPLCDPDCYTYDHNLADIAALWRRVRVRFESGGHQERLPTPGAL